MIILTGASGGIGKAIIPEIFYGNIENVLGIYNNTKPVFDKIIYEQADLTNIKQTKETLFRHNLTHITLIHLATVKIDELAMAINEADWDRVFNVNLKGAFFLTKELLPIMLKEKWGRIIFITSSGLTDVGTLLYSTSKGALSFMSSTLARECGRYGITSNVIQLGYYDVGLWQKLPKVKQDELLNQIPSKKLGSPQNIVNAIKFIIDSDYLNGGVITLDGGL